MLLAKEYSEKYDVKDYLISEKLDGIRAIYDSKKKKFITKNGNQINAPDFFFKNIPENINFDGELWHSRNAFEKVSVVRKKNPIDEDWKSIKFMIFDMPDCDETFENKVNIMKSLKLNEYFKVLDFHVCKDHEDLMDMLEIYVKQGSEGLMLRKKNSRCPTGKSDSLLKLKKYSDDEAIVIGYEDGNGRIEGMVGALIVRNKDNKIFKLGSGLTDKVRKNPPKIGSTITYKYNELTHNGIPRFPRFYRERPEE